MNYMQTLTLIEESGETILAQDIRSLITNKHRYISQAGVWNQDKEPGSPEKKQTRGGIVWIWKRTEEV